MNSIKKYRYEIIIFWINAVGMILELIASRVLSPYFGSSNIIWTSIIGIILLSGSIGNYLGGKIADKDGREDNLKLIFLMSSIFIFMIPLFQEDVLRFIVKMTSNIKIGAILATSILFLIPSIFIGIVTPILLKLKLNSLENAGKTAGNLYAISTLGAIIGTFLGGFLLIPNIGSVYILYILTVAVLILPIFVDGKIKNKFTIVYVLISIFILSIMFLKIRDNNDKGRRVLAGEVGIKVSYDTQYGRVIIYNVDTKEGDKLRVLNIDSGYESIGYANEEKAYDIYSKYIGYYDLMFKANPDIKRVAMIGGAGYSYPKHYISNNEDTIMDVIEIDGDITEIAKKYFYLDKLIDEYDLKNNKRLRLITEDGRVFFNTTNNKYDAILNDAFSGNTPAKTLTTLEAIQNIKRCLNNNGYYLTNIISSVDGENSKFLKAEVNTLKKVFKNVYVIPCIDDISSADCYNNMVIATDDEVRFDNSYNIELSEKEIVLTDDYCPIDTLIPVI